MSERTAWTLDPAHTHVEFAVRHLMIATVKGKFTGVSGTVSTVGEDLETARIEAQLDASSITTGNEQRDRHLRSADFLDTEQFPTLAFRSTSVQRLPDGTFRVAGDLTIRNVTRPIELVASPEGTAKDPWGGYRAGFTVSARINRKDFGMTWNQAIETGGVLVGDEVRISVELELIRAGLPIAA